MTEKRLQRKLAKIKKRGEQYKQIKALEDAYAEYMPDKKKRKVSNIMLVVIVIAILAYTIAAFWMQYLTGMQIDSTLSTLYYGFWVTELVSLTTIKNSKTKYGAENESINYGC